MKNIFFTIAACLAGIAIICVAASTIAAQELSSSAVRYARFSSVSGDVQFQPVSAVEPREADINMPFLEGDRLFTNSDGSAEIMIDDGSIVWVWANSKLDMTRLAGQSDGMSQNTQIRLWVGEVICRFRNKANPDSIQTIQVGETHITASSTALFYLFVNPEHETRIHVLSGEIRAESAGGVRVLIAGTMSVLAAETAVWQDSDVSTDNVFKDWVLERDKWHGGQYQPDTAAPEDVTQRAPGLERDGRWVFNNHLSMWCWTPYVSVEWAPYRFGFWDYIPGWGWTWIPNEPWGWVVYHYGYWAYYYEFGWMWVPHWRWGPHWAAWRYSGRSVHWVPIHPEDNLDTSGRLVEGIQPRNSRLEIGIPVESTHNFEGLPNDLSGPMPQNLENSGAWTNNPSTEFHSMLGSQENHLIRPLPGRSGAISSGDWRGVPSDSPLRGKSIQKPRPGLQPPQNKKSVPLKSPELNQAPRPAKKELLKTGMDLSAATLSIKKVSGENRFWNAVGKVLAKSAKTVTKGTVAVAKSSKGLLSK